MNMESITPGRTPKERSTLVLTLDEQAQEMANQKQLGILNEKLKTAVAKSERLEQSHVDMEQKHKDAQAKHNDLVCPSSLRLPRCSTG